ncbi:MAG: helicase-related protein, partial [Candidatus Spechtbacterales bacterium]
QRAHLLHAHGTSAPHLLSMTATPIPRTLALTVYGDLDISLLREMPHGRKKIDTRLVAEYDRADMFAFIRKELDAGRQAFVVFPLVEESEKLEAKAATQECARLAEGPFKNYSVGLLHGRMKPKEKDDTMQAFKDKKIQVLVATSVVEVGIDVPNATVMMIENADRFGLAQLHQFRGRVGRSELQSYCFLFTDSTSSYARKRMKALVEARDGFELAEYDLAFRGPGEVYGTRQSGMDDMIISSLADRPLVEHTRALAEELLQYDPELSDCPALAEKVARKQEVMHFE